MHKSLEERESLLIISLTTLTRPHRLTLPESAHGSSTGIYEPRFARWHRRPDCPVVEGREDELLIVAETSGIRPCTICARLSR